MIGIGNRFIKLGNDIGKRGEPFKKLGTWLTDEKVGKGYKVAALFGLTAAAFVALPIVLAGAMITVATSPFTVLVGAGIYEVLRKRGDLQFDQWVTNKLDELMGSQPRFTEI